MSELHAFRPVSTAFEKTRKLLLEPFDLGAWIKLVLITFFVGSGSTSFNPANNLQYVFNRGDFSHTTYTDLQHALSDSTIIAIILLVVAVSIGLILLMSYLRGVLSFVMIDALTTGNVRIVQPFKENMGRGFKVFVFNVVVFIVSLIVIGVIIAGMILGILAALGGGDIEAASTWNTMSTASILLLVATVLIGLLALLVYAVIIGLFVGFFYDFGVPFMYFRNLGLRQSIGEVWRLVGRQPLEFLVYVVVRWMLELAIGIFLGIVVLFIMAIFVGAGLLIVLAMIGLAGSSLVVMLLLALALIIGILLLIIVSAFISMPFQVYLRYYSLDFLKSFDPSFVNYTGRMA
jgi:hypothetical protein